MMGLRVLLRLCRFSARYFLLCLAFAIAVFLVAPLLLGLVTQVLFDRLAGTSAPLTGWEAVIGIAAIQIFVALSSPLFGNPWSPMQQKAMALLRRNLLESTIEAFGRDQWTIATGDAVGRFSEDPRLIADTMDALCDLVGRTLFVITAGVVMWAVTPVAVLALGVPIVVSFAVSQLCRRQIARNRVASRVSSGSVTAFLGDVTAGQLAIKVAGAAPNVVARLEELGDHRRRSEVRDTVFDAILEGFNINIGNLSLGLTLLLLAPAMARGSFTIGDLAMFAVFLDAVTWFPDEIGRLLAGLKQTEVSLERMAALAPGQAPERLSIPAAVYLDGSLPSVPPPPVGSRFERLAVRGLTCRYPTSGGGVEHVSFDIERGSLVVISGAVGSGKSTLLKALLGLVPAESGEIVWNGERVDDPAEFLVSPRVSYLPQTPRLFSETLVENILLGWPADRDELARAVRQAVLEEDISRLQSGADTQLGPRGLKLSGGQIQRVAAARMFVRDSELLVIDDVSSALDAHTEAEMWARLLDGHRDRTLLVVSHRPTVLDRADQIIRLEPLNQSWAATMNSVHAVMAE